MHDDGDILLSVEDLRTYFYTYRGVVKAVDGVSFQIKKGQIVGLIGESGCGKSVTGSSILRLVEKPGKIEGGRIIFENEDLLQKSQDEMRQLRGGKISMVFQDPMSSLNPVFNVGDQIIESVQKHKHIGKAEAKAQALEILDKVRIPNAARIMKRYPHELSGGMAQRVIIAISIACEPSLIIADEATSALDATIQAQILRLIRELNSKLGTSVLMITHDFGVLAQVCDSAIVMYAGNLIECGPTENILKNPLHPYTRGLMNAIPRLTKDQKKLNTISGTVPDLINAPSGCLFNTRCEFAERQCSQQKPSLIQAEKGHWASCFLIG